MPLGTPARRMPIPEDVRDVFGDLLGKPVSASKTAPIEFREDPSGFVTGIYIEDDGTVGGACIADLPLAASAGAALALMPSTVAEEAIDAGELSDGLNENFFEVANIISQLLNGPSVPHLRIRELVAGVPADVTRLATTARGQKHYDVTIVGYPGGKVSLLAR